MFLYKIYKLSLKLSQSLCLLFKLTGSKCPSSAMTTHTICASGTYQTGTGQTTCDDCTGGHQCSNNAVSPVQCLAGQYAPAKSTSCTPCASGRSHAVPPVLISYLVKFCPFITFSSHFHI